MSLQRIVFKLSDYELDMIEKMAREIHACPVRNRGRTYSVVERSVKNGSILEFALERQGAFKNNLPFDVTNRESYAWDVIWEGKKTEVKRKNFLSNDSTKYYSWDNPSYVQTFLNNLDIVEQLIVGDYKEIEKDTFVVEWMLMTDVGQDFKRYIKKSMYNKGQMYYNHLQDKSCKYLRT